MSSAGSVDGDERLRLFLALRLPDDVVSSIADWQRRELVDAKRPAASCRPATSMSRSRSSARGPQPSSPAFSRCSPRPHATPHRLASRSPATGRRAPSGCSHSTRHAAGDGAELAGRVQAELAALGVYRPERASVAAARHRPPLPRTAAVAPGAAHTRLDVVRCCCFSFTSAPVRGSVRGARIVSARRLSR